MTFYNYKSATNNQDVDKLTHVQLKPFSTYFCKPFSFIGLHFFQEKTFKLFISNKKNFDDVVNLNYEWIDWYKNKTILRKRF